MREWLSGKVRLVEGESAALIGRTLVIADVHIGIEKELWREGVRASGISEKALGSFERLLEKTRPSKIVINGDLKHNIPLFTKREAETVRKFVEAGRDYGEVLVVKGNHDGGIEGIVDGVVGNYVKIRGIWITHGHVRLEERPVIIGHVHPAYPLDFHFRKEPVKVWLVGEEVLVLPAFSPFIVGNDITDPENWLGPIARRVRRFDVLTPDGYLLGSVENVYPPPQAGVHRPG